MIQAFFKGKSGIQVAQNEDFKTSSSIGLLKYLPDDVFWNIMRNSCIGLNTNEFGKILSFNFWSHTDPTDTTNDCFVEPDVWIETENFDVLIEAKVADGAGQYEQQWKNEIQSILNEQSNNDYQKPIVLIALGGNENLQPDTVLLKDEDFPVFKSSWHNLILSVVRERDLSDTNDSICRLLEDVIELFARQGIMKMEWFNTLPLASVDAHALDLWRTIKSKPSVGFASIPQMIINETNIQQWKPIN